MKTKKLLFSIFLLAFVFNMASQNVTIVIANAVTDIYLTEVVKNDTELLLAGPLLNASLQGRVKIQNRHTGAVTTNVVIEEPGGEVRIDAATFISGQNFFVSYLSDWVGGISQHTFQVHDIPTGNVIRKDFASASPQHGFTDGQYYYLSLSTSTPQDYDPMNSGLEPYNVIGGNSMAKIDQSGNVLWHKALQAGEGPTKKVFILPNGNLGISLHQGNLIELDINTGDFVQVLVDGEIADQYEIEDGIIKTFDHSERSLSIGNEQTDWAPNNFWLGFVETTRKIDGKIYCLGYGRKYVMGENLVHGSKKVILPSSYGTVESSWIEDDKSASYVVTLDNVTSVLNVPHTETEVPTLNSNGTNVVSVYDGQRYLISGTDNGTWADDYERVGTIVLDGTMPVEGDLASYDWVNVPAGMELRTGAWVAPIIKVDNDGSLFVRFVFKIVGTQDSRNRNNLRVYLVSSSSMSVEENSLDKITAYYSSGTQSIMISSKEPIVQGVVYDALGREVVVFGNKDEVFLGNLATGTYIVRLLSQYGKILNKKFIKY